MIQGWLLYSHQSLFSLKENMLTVLTVLSFDNQHQKCIKHIKYHFFPENFPFFNQAVDWSEDSFKKWPTWALRCAKWLVVPTMCGPQRVRVVRCRHPKPCELQRARSISTNQVVDGGNKHILAILTPTKVFHSLNSNKGSSIALLTPTKGFSMIFNHLYI